MGTLRSAMIYSNLIPKSYLSYNIYGNDQLINQSINQSINQPTNQPPTNQPTNQLSNQPMNRPMCIQLVH